MTAKKRFLNENHHLELTFQLRTDELAEDFLAQKACSELEPLYRIFNEYAAEVECRAQLFRPLPEGGAHGDIEILRQAIIESPHASQFKRCVNVMLPHDGNLKNLWRSLATSPVFAPAIEQDSVKVELGGYTDVVGFFNEGGEFTAAEQLEFLPPVHRPRVKSATYT